VIEKFGVPPEAIQDFLGLCGDAVDNIPGVPGIGPKTATALLQEYQTVEGVYENLEAIASLKVRGAKTLGAKLAEHKDKAFLSKQLATVAYDAPIDSSASKLLRQSAEVSLLQEIGQIMGGRGDGLFERLIHSSKLVQAV
jgi:DNA polymerase-1